MTPTSSERVCNNLNSNLSVPDDIRRQFSLTCPEPYRQSYNHSYSETTSKPTTTPLPPSLTVIMCADGGGRPAERAVSLAGSAQHLDAVPCELPQLRQRRLVRLVPLDHLVLRSRVDGWHSVEQSDDDLGLSQQLLSFDGAHYGEGASEGDDRWG